MKKDIKFSTRMASADREKIRALAAKAHMSMSDYVTACCLGKRIIVIDGQKDLLRQLKGIGSNIKHNPALERTKHRHYRIECRNKVDQLRNIDVSDLKIKTGISAAGTTGLIDHHSLHIGIEGTH